MTVSSKVRYGILSHARRFLQYYGNKSFISPAIPMILDENINKYVVNRIILTTENIDKIKTNTNDSYICDPEKIFYSIEPFIAKLVEKWIQRCC